jgi:integrase/recombinase XerD
MLRWRCRYSFHSSDAFGHADLKTTQIYTHVAIRQLQEIHRATHPAQLTRDRPSTPQARQDAADVLAARDAENGAGPEPLA